MPFEYDLGKSAANQRKHGIDFERAQALWDDPRAVGAPTRTGDEPRFIVVGMIGAKHWTAICTMRGERVRIISVRRARKDEVRHYDGE
jgi:uncharacterized DUF497 family protein